MLILIKVNYSTDISSINNQGLEPAPGFPEGIVPKFIASILIYLPVLTVELIVIALRF